MQRNAVSSGDHFMVISHVHRTLVTMLHAALYPTRASEMCDGKAGQRTYDSLFQVTWSREAKRAQGVGYYH